MQSLEECRRQVADLFPEQRAEVTSLGLIDLSCLISGRVVEALGDGQHAVAVRAARLASWAWERGRHDESLTHFAMDVLSESVRREPLRRELWRALPEDLFRILLPAFCGALRRDAVAELEREYRHVVR